MPKVVTELQSREDLIAAADELREIADAIRAEVKILEALDVNKVVARRVPVEIIRKWLQDVREVTSHAPERADHREE